MDLYFRRFRAAPQRPQKPPVLDKQGILEKLQEKAGPEARKLFEKFMRDVEKLQAEQEPTGG